jgi:hypothetical protein
VRAPGRRCGWTRRGRPCRAGRAGSWRSPGASPARRTRTRRSRSTPAPTAHRPRAA